MSSAGPDAPTFHLGLRGYARGEVDEYVAVTARQLAAAHERLREAERRHAEALEQAEQALAAERARAQQAAERAERAQSERDAALARIRAANDAERTAPAGMVDPYPAEPTADPSPSERTVPTTTVATDAIRLPDAEPARAPRAPLTPRDALLHRAPRRRRRLGAGLALGAASLVALTPVAMSLLDRGDAGTRTSSLPSPAASTRTGPVAGQAAPPAAAPRVAPAPASVPAGWTAYRSPDRLWSIALPPGWRAVGSGSGLQFVSGSGLSSMTVRTAPASSSQALQGYEARSAAERPGYRRLSSASQRFRGDPARTWDYTWTADGRSQRASDLAVLVDGRVLLLHVESRASSWRFAAPLVEGFRASFTPA